jgi:hypothetical protein
MHYVLCIFVKFTVGMNLGDTKRLCITRFMHYYVMHYD